MTKGMLKTLYREYIFGAGTDGYKMKNGKSWDRMIPTFAFGLPESEREIIHQEWYDRNKTVAA